jgi:hypothetical protein
LLIGRVGKKKQTPIEHIIKIEIAKRQNNKRLSSIPVMSSSVVVDVGSAPRLNDKLAAIVLRGRGLDAVLSNFNAANSSSLLLFLAGCDVPDGGDGFVPATELLTEWGLYCTEQMGDSVRTIARGSDTARALSKLEACLAKGGPYIAASPVMTVIDVIVVCRLLQYMATVASGRSPGDGANSSVEGWVRRVSRDIGELDENTHSSWASALEGFAFAPALVSPRSYARAGIL